MQIRKMQAEEEPVGGNQKVEDVPVLEGELGMAPSGSLGIHNIVILSAHRGKADACKGHAMASHS